MEMADPWGWLPDEILLEIFKNLDAPNLARIGAVNRHWYHVTRDDPLWKKHFEKAHVLWDCEETQICDNFFDEFIYFKQEVPTSTAQVIDDYGYLLNNVTYSSNGTYFAVCGDAAHFCVYLSTPSIEFLDERQLLDWKSTDLLEFCPNETKLLVNGIRLDGKREFIVFSIDSDQLEIHYICRVLCSPEDFTGCWFDDRYVISGELYNFSNSTALGTSISQIWLCSVPSHRYAVSETSVCPFLRILNRGGHVKFPVVSRFVSTRFRRVLQMSEEAQWEGKTLSDKVGEIKMSAHMRWEDDQKGFQELRELFDRPSNCSLCYLKHTLTEEEYGGKLDCHCICHHENDRMLIYVSGEFSQRVCFKMITQEFIQDVLNFRNLHHEEDDVETGDPDDTFNEGMDYIMKRVHLPDHYLEFGGVINGIELSEDQKILAVSLETVEEDATGNVIGTQTEQPRIDLEKMITETRSVYGKKGRQPHVVNEHLIVGKDYYYDYKNSLLLQWKDSFTQPPLSHQNDVHIWSRNYGGPTIGRLEHPLRVRKVAVHPKENMVLACCGSELHVWSSQRTV